MPRKPRKQRLSAARVREKIVTQQQRCQKQQASRVRDQAMTTLLVEFLKNIHTKIQTATEADPHYLPLLGADWYETLNLLTDHIASLKNDGPPEQAAEVMRRLRITDDEMGKMVTAILALALCPSEGTRAEDKSVCGLTPNAANACVPASVRRG